MSASIENRKTKVAYFWQQKPKGYRTWYYEDGPFESLDEIKAKIERDTQFYGREFYTGRKAYDYRIVKRTTKIASEEIICEGNKRCLTLLSVKLATPRRKRAFRRCDARIQARPSA